jgi:hypothetical protein
MSTSPRQSGATHLFGLVPISMFLRLDESETLRRIESGEIPVERAGSMPILSKQTTREIMASAHWRREKLSA